MPLLRAELARRLFERAVDVDACVPVVDGYPVPTCAVYARAAAARARELLALRELRPRAFLDRVRTRYIPERELREVDPELASFLDCDDEASYRKALAAAGLG
jgi:molybdopterin-guanine dinucleotide biosynthesis protein A